MRNASGKRRRTKSGRRRKSVSLSARPLLDTVIWLSCYRWTGQMLSKWPHLQGFDTPSRSFVAPETPQGNLVCQLGSDREPCYKRWAQHLKERFYPPPTVTEPDRPSSPSPFWLPPSRLLSPTRTYSFCSAEIAGTQRSALVSVAESYCCPVSLAVTC